MRQTPNQSPQIQIFELNQSQPIQAQPLAQKADHQPARTRGQLRREIAQAAHQRARVVKEANELDALFDFDE